ncbi:hypothetical protein B0H13DRAFT_2366935 [Mycena leptocephala]|nr:hypothetical protein B0H13DRAFT_2366935 [Mycena leptocephala]
MVSPASFSMETEFLAALHAHANALPNLWDAVARAHVDLQKHQLHTLAQRTPLPPSPTLSQELEYQSLLSFDDETPSPFSSKSTSTSTRASNSSLPASSRSSSSSSSSSLIYLPSSRSLTNPPDLKSRLVLFYWSINGLRHNPSDTRQKPECQTPQRPPTRQPRLSSLSSSPDFPDVLFAAEDHII